LGIDEVELTRERCRAVGMLLRTAGTTDVVNATLVEAATDGDDVLTSDPADIRRLADAGGKKLTVIPI
jgi:hypothetical protein